jgi:hypothetical protein
MSVRTLLTRVAIIAGCASAFVGVAAPAAHAIPQSATATLECEPLNGGPWLTANWHIHLNLDASAPYGVRGAAPPERWDDVRRAWMERISTDERVRDAYAELYRHARMQG